MAEAAGDRVERFVREHFAGASLQPPNDTKFILGFGYRTSQPPCDSDKGARRSVDGA